MKNIIIVFSDFSSNPHKYGLVLAVIFSELVWSLYLVINDKISKS